MLNDLVKNPTFLTVISGVLVYSFSQLILEVVINPQKEYKRLRQKIIYTISLYCCYYHNPYDLLNPKSNVREKEEYELASKEMRKIGAELASYIGIVPKFRFKKRQKLKNVMSALIGISNGFYNVSKDFDTCGENRKCEMIIKKELNFLDGDENIMKKIKLWIKNATEPFILTILSLVAAIFVGLDSIKWGNWLEFILFSIPFILCLIITILTNIFINKRIIKIISNFISALLVFVIPIYYLIISFDSGLYQLENPLINIKYYERYYNNVDVLKKVFPKEIPQPAENIEFKYYPGLLQGATEYSLYYIDPNMTFEKFDKLYKNKSEWTGSIKEYNEKEGLLSGIFNSIAIKSDKENFKIYLIEGKCDKSGYCNHGNYWVTAINKDTKEIIYKYSNW